MILLIALSTLIGPPTNAPCSVGELRRSVGYIYRQQRIAEFVQDAPVIVRARVVGPDSGRSVRNTDGVHNNSFPGIRFAVLERLKGDRVPDTLTLGGYLVDRDDFNYRPIPYQMVRPSGHRGECYTRQYRAGAEYLLILNYQAGTLTPYWMPLAPLNEQLRGADDPWLAWVRLQLAAIPADTSGV